MLGAPILCHSEKKLQHLCKGFLTLEYCLCVCRNSKKYDRCRQKRLPSLPKRCGNVQSRQQNFPGHKFGDAFAFPDKV